MAVAADGRVTSLQKEEKLENISNCQHQEQQEDGLDRWKATFSKKRGFWKGLNLKISQDWIY